MVQLERRSWTAEDTQAEHFFRYGKASNVSLAKGTVTEGTFSYSQEFLVTYLNNINAIKASKNLHKNGREPEETEKSQEVF
jgi:hypothetical protein